MYHVWLILWESRKIYYRVRSWTSWPSLKTSLYLSLIVLKSRLDRNWKKTTCQICISILYVCHTRWRRCITSTDLLNIEDQSNLVQHINNKNYFVFLLSYIDTPLSGSLLTTHFFHPRHKINYIDCSCNFGYTNTMWYQCEETRCLHAFAYIETWH